jgi:hypothetical protein
MGGGVVDVEVGFVDVGIDCEPCPLLPPLHAVVQRGTLAKSSRTTVAIARGEWSTSE